MLIVRMRVRILAAIEQNEHHAGLIAIDRHQKLLDALKICPGIPFPGKVMEEHLDAVKASPLGPAQPRPAPPRPPPPHPAPPPVYKS